MGAHFWGQVGATAVDCALVLSLAGRQIEHEAIRCELHDVNPSGRFFSLLTATIIGGVFLCMVIWS